MLFRMYNTCVLVGVHKLEIVRITEPCYGWLLAKRGAVPRFRRVGLNMPHQIDVNDDCMATCWFAIEFLLLMTRLSSHFI